MNETTAIKTKRLLINLCKYVLLIFAAFVALVPIVSCIFTAFKRRKSMPAPTSSPCPRAF